MVCLAGALVQTPNDLGRHFLSTTCFSLVHDEVQTWSWASLQCTSGSSFQRAQDGESATFSQVEAYLVSHISHESQLNAPTIAIAYCIACDCALQTRRGSCVSSATGRVGSATLQVWPALSRRRVLLKIEAVSVVSISEPQVNKHKLNAS